MKTALCLSGHLRTFKNTFQSLKDHVINPMNCDVFIHTWDTIGAPTGKNPGDIDYENTSTNLYKKDIDNFLNPLDIRIENQAQLTQSIKQTTDHIKVSEENKQYIIKDIALHIAMFYSIFKVNEMRRMWESHKNIKYDRVIRCRPDMFFHTSLHPHMFEEHDTIYVPIIGRYIDNGINDQLAIASGENMDIYCDVFEQATDYYAAGNCRPESIIKSHLDSNKVKYKSIDINYDIYRLDGNIYRQFEWHGQILPGNFRK